MEQEIKSMKPVLFSTEMVQAILSGRKTVTRRVVKIIVNDDEPVPHFRCNSVRPAINKNGLCANFYDMRGFYCGAAKQVYCPSDILYVRETWAECEDTGGYLYRAWTEFDPEIEDKAMKRLGLKWRPSIHMPKEAARIFLRVKNVRVEQLFTPFFEDGSAVFALQQEGMTLPEECIGCIENYGHPCCLDSESECGILDDVRSNFSYLWDSTIKKADLLRYGWDANPWVWVIEFERIDKPNLSAMAPGRVPAGLSPKALTTGSRG